MAKLAGIETYRRIVTRVILVVLGLAVAASLLGIFAGASLDGGRFWASVSVSFGCSVALFLCSRALSSPKTQRAGLFAIIVVLMCYGMGLAAAWAPPGMAFWASGEHLGLSSLFLLLVGIVAAFMFQIFGDPANRLAGGAGMLMCVVALAFTQSYAFFDQWQQEYLLAWGMMALGASLLMAACLAGRGQAVGKQPGVVKKRGVWRWIGVLATAAAYITTLSLWSRIDTYSSSADLRNYYGSIAALWETAGIFAVASLLWLADLTPQQGKLLRWPTVAFSILSAIFCVCICFTGADISTEPLITELMGAFTVLSIAGLLAVQILSNMRRKPEDAVKQYDVSQVQIVCPYCNQQRTVATGGGSCSECGMQFVVQVHEPRCPQCEYSLLMNRSGRCPECGWVIPANFGAAPNAAGDGAASSTPPMIPPTSAADSVEPPTPTPTVV